MSAAPLSKEVVRAVRSYQRTAYRWINCKVSWAAMERARDRLLNLLNLNASHDGRPRPVRFTAFQNRHIGCSMLSGKRVYNHAATCRHTLEDDAPKPARKGRR